MTRQERIALDDDEFEAARLRVTEPNHGVALTPPAERTPERPRDDLALAAAQR